MVPLDTNLIADRESLPRHGYCPTPCSMKARLADARVGYHIGGNGDRPPPQHQAEQHPSDDRDRAAAVPPRSTISWRERFTPCGPFATISSTHHAGIRTCSHRGARSDRELLVRVGNRQQVQRATVQVVVGV